MIWSDETTLNRVGLNGRALVRTKPGPGLRTSKVVGLSTLGVDYQCFGAVQPFSKCIIYAHESTKTGSSSVGHCKSCIKSINEVHGFKLGINKDRILCFVT